jgi:PAS domain S-box-containing protein
MWIVALIFNFTSESSLTFESISGLKQVVLPWGEEFTIPVGITNNWKYLADITSLLILIFIIDASIRLWKRGNKRRSSIVGGSIIFFIVLAGVHTPLVDEGIVKTPYLISIAFLSILIAMSFELLSDVIKIPILSKEILSKELRWKNLLNNMQVSILEVDRHEKISYANPFYIKFFGYNDKEIIGKHYSEFLTRTEKESVSKFAKSINHDENIPLFRLKMAGADGTIKIVDWQSVRIFDSDGEWTSSLSVGIDITEQQNAYEEITTLKEQLEKENIVLREEILYPQDNNEILGNSSVIKYSLSRVQQVAPTDTTILIEGETGVGKDLFARLIHKVSGRNDKPFNKVNCAVIPANLLESELFGHEKGAFTGAQSLRKGRFEYADGATLFLDEIGELPLELQAKLLRVLEEGEFERLGSNKTIKVDVRVITATNRILKDEVSKGNFREDLFYRINAYPISIPPLRKRKTDIPIFVETFVNQFSRKLGKSITEISKPTMEMLKNYEWPGNIRELRNIIERGVISTLGKQLQLIDNLNVNEIKSDESENFRSLQKLEFDYIKKVLEACKWKIEGKNGAAEILKLHPNTLRSKIKKLGINKSR